MRRVLSVSPILVVLFLIVSLLPVSLPAAAQDDNCPEGLVYYPEGEICLLPENVPTDDTAAEPVDDADNNQSDTTDDAVGDEADSADDLEDGQDASDQTDDDAIDPEEDVVDTGDAPTEDDVGNESESPAETISNLTLRSYSCAEGTDPTAGVADLNSICTVDGAPSLNYTVNVDNSLVGTYTLQAGDGARAAISISSANTPIPTGTMVIMMSPVESWTTLLVTCTVTAIDGAQQSLDQPISGESISFPVAAGDSVTCDWYTTPGTSQTPVDTDNLQGVVGNPPAATGTRVNFRVYNCDAGTVATDDLSAKCQTPAVGVAFTVSSETTNIASGTTNGDGNVEFVDVPDGPSDGAMAFIETVPTGYGEPVVVCMGSFVPEGYREVLHGNQIRIQQLNMDSDEPYLDCTWFNIPATGPEDGPDILIRVLGCGYLVEYPVDLTLGQAEQLCDAPYPGIPLHVQDGRQTIADDVTDSLGIAAFTRLPISGTSGDYSILAEIAYDEDVAAIFCDLSSGDGNFNVISPQSLGPGHIGQTLAPGNTMRCSWFISSGYEQGVDSGTVLVAKLCAPGADLTQADLSIACPTDGVRISFSILVPGAVHPFKIYTSTEGEINVPAGGGGTYTIAPRTPPGYGNPAYRCAITWPDGSSEESDVVSLTTETPSHDLTWPPDSEITCTYYFPGDAGQGLAPGEEAAAGVDPGLYFFVRQCPSSTPLDANKSETCVLPTESPQYTMTIDGQPWLGGDFLGVRGVSIQQANTTDQPVEYITGESVISIAPMPGMGDPFYECNVRRANGAEGVETGRLDRNNVVLTYTWNLDDLIVCTIYYWPEVPADPGTGDEQVPADQQGVAANPGEESDAAIASATTPNTLTIQFWTCPDGVDPADAQVNLLLSCAMDQTSRAVTVTTDAGAQETSVTGSAAWPFAGSQVSVTQPDGGAASSAWCSSTWIDNGEDGAEFPDAVSLDGGVLSLTVSHAATTVYCDWFLFGITASGEGATMLAPIPAADHTAHSRRWSG